MENGKSAISGATSYQQMGEFWDEQDLGQVWEQTQEAQFEVELESTVAYFPVETTLAAQLRQVAQQRGVSAQTLLNLWVQEKVAQDSPVSS